MEAYACCCSFQTMQKCFGLVRCICQYRYVIGVVGVGNCCCGNFLICLSLCLSLSLSLSLNIYIYIYNINSCWQNGLHTLSNRHYHPSLYPVSAQSRCIQVFTGRFTLAYPLVGLQSRTSLLLQQYLKSLIRLIGMVCEMGYIYRVSSHIDELWCNKSVCLMIIIHTHTHTHTHTYIYIYIYVCVCVYVCMVY